jgi:CRP-like cAMP-binding protein
VEIDRDSLADTLEATLEALAQRAAGVSRRRYGRGERLCCQDDPAGCFFFLYAGRVRTFVLSPNGREKTLLIAGAGDLVGDVPFYLGCPHLESAEAFSAEVEAYQIEGTGLEELLDRQPSLARALLANLAARVRLFTEELISQSFEDVRGQLQLVLLQLAGKYGRVTYAGVAIDMRLTHEELAKLVGANRATVSACLSQLQHEGFYRMIDQRIVLAPWAVGQLPPP